MLTFFIIIIGHLLPSVSTSTWSEWWTYEGISGPEYWGMVNPEWILCSKGRRQSPININLSLLLFDPRLDQPLKVDSNKVSVLMMNSGHELKLIIDEPGSNCVNISGGPLSYTYRVTEIIFHFGASDKEGSEHSIDNKTFPAEVQIVCYNSDLYGNLSHAQYSTNGLLMISLLAQISQTGNSELESIISHMSSVTYKGDMVRIRHLSIYDMMPSDSNYITYEGSMTQPGCLETVTWIILNRPLYVTHNQLSKMRGLRQGGADNPKAPVSNNFRTTMPINRRPIRTNIDFTNPVGGCTMHKNNFQYQMNQRPTV